MESVLTLVAWVLIGHGLLGAFRWLWGSNPVHGGTAIMDFLFHLLSVSSMFALAVLLWPTGIEWLKVAVSIGCSAAVVTAAQEMTDRATVQTLGRWVRNEAPF